MVQALGQLCHPRDSVFDPSIRDTVYSIDDLPSINAKAFFAENFVTEGMRQLLTEAFTRLEGKNQSASGAYLLSQSMGGGKTHNLLALGLLARNPALRPEVMGEFYEPGPLGAVRVAAFSGRKNTTNGIWGEMPGNSISNRHFPISTPRSRLPPMTTGPISWTALPR